MDTARDTANAPPIDGDRLWSSLMEMAAIGATAAGGVERLAASEADGAARDRLAEWCRAAGCAVHVDAVGNMFARRPGTDPGRAPVQIGSHLDTVHDGGRFDGAYGVLAGLEAIRALNDAGVETAAPIELVNWTNEEGARFPVSVTGSRVFAGGMALEDALQLTDADGMRLDNALDSIGYRGSAAPGHPVGAYLEAHIEQATVLEAAGLEVGIVSGIQARGRLRIDLHGATAHAGTAPLDTRRDALLAAARIVVAVRERAQRRGDRMRATVGRLVSRPGAVNVVAEEASLYVDARHPEDAVLSAYFRELEAAARGIAGEEGCTITVETLAHAQATRFHPHCLDALRAAAADRAIPTEELFSGGGHDAGPIADIAPAGMLFVACENGVSHNPAESITPQAAAAGCAVLAGAARRLADAPPA